MVRRGTTQYIPSGCVGVILKGYFWLMAICFIVTLPPLAIALICGLYNKLDGTAGRKFTQTMKEHPFFKGVAIAHCGLLGVMIAVVFFVQMCGQLGFQQLEQIPGYALITFVMSVSLKAFLVVGLLVAALYLYLKIRASSQEG